MMKDVHKTKENPIRVMENMLGIPLMGIHRYMKEEHKSPGPKTFLE
jgi:hypothetical protein